MPTPNGPRPCVAVFNSDREYIDLIAGVLRGAGYEALPGHAGPGAHAAIRAARPCAVVLDVEVWDGKQAWALLEKLLFDPATASIPVVLCTAAAQSVESYQPTLARRGVRTLPKPFTRDELLAALQAALASPSAAASDADVWGPLSPRQRDVAVLVAKGLTNRQVAGALVLEEGTVANHVRAVLLKLGLNSRGQLGVWVAKDTLRRSAAGIE
jgi:DNA-binding NarL/FixJ family response regulator